MYLLFTLLHQWLAVKGLLHDGGLHKYWKQQDSMIVVAQDTEIVKSIILGALN